MMSKELETRQLFDHTSGTYTYLLYDKSEKEAIIIDPVLEQVKRDIKLITELGLNLKYIFDTHVHADHITSSYLLKKELGALIGLSKNAKTSCADIQIEDAQEFSFGKHQLKSIHTPGHTQSCVTYECEGNLFTGDALLIRRCGRTDFQEGNSRQLFASVRNKLFKLPEEYRIYPGHDYSGLTSSTIGEEKKLNERLAMNISEDEFVSIMEKLKLEKPQKLEIAVPRNLNCGQDTATNN